MDVPKEQRLLMEVEDLIRTMPPRETLRHPTDENLSWLGRARGVLNNWDITMRVEVYSVFESIYGTSGTDGSMGVRKLISLLHAERQDLLMKTPSAATSLAV